MKLTLEDFINLIYSESKLVYFYEYEPTYVEKSGNYDFSHMEVFLIFYSSIKPRYMLLPNVCKRTISQIYFDNDVIRVVLDDEDNQIGGTSKNEM